MAKDGVRALTRVFLFGGNGLRWVSRGEWGGGTPKVVKSMQQRAVVGERAGALSRARDRESAALPSTAMLRRAPLREMIPGSRGLVSSRGLQNILFVGSQ